MTGPREPSPLGRYDDSAPDDQAYEVRLLGVPVRVLAASRQQHDDLMHEFALLAVTLEDRASVPARMLELIDTLGTKYAGTAEQPRSDFEQLGFERALEAQTMDGADLSPGQLDLEPFATMQPVLPAICRVTRITGIEAGHPP